MGAALRRISAANRPMNSDCRQFDRPLGLDAPLLLKNDWMIA